MKRSLALAAAVAACAAPAAYATANGWHVVASATATASDQDVVAAIPERTFLAPTRELRLDADVAARAWVSGDVWCQTGAQVTSRSFQYRVVMRSAGPQVHRFDTHGRRNCGIRAQAEAVHGGSVTLTLYRR